MRQAVHCDAVASKQVFSPVRSGAVGSRRRAQPGWGMEGPSRPTKMIQASLVSEYRSTFLLPTWEDQSGLLRSFTGRIYQHGLFSPGGRVWSRWRSGRTSEGSALDCRCVKVLLSKRRRDGICAELWNQLSPPSPPGKMLLSCFTARACASDKAVRFFSVDSHRWNQRTSGDALIKDLKPLLYTGTPRSSIILDR